MEIVGTNRILSIYADSEQYTYEADNLLSQIVGLSFRGLSNTATLYCGVSASSSYPSDTFFLKGSNASVVSVSKGDFLSMDWGDSSVWGGFNNEEWATTTYSSESTDLSRVTSTDKVDTYVKYTKSTKDHVLKVELSAPTGYIISAQAVFAGERKEFRDPNLTVTGGLFDYSIKYPLNNGANYVDKREGDVVRTFTGSFDADQNNDLWTYLDMLQREGSKPMIWRIFSKSMTSSDWLVLGSIVDLSAVNCSHDRPGYSLCSFTVREDV